MVFTAEQIEEIKLKAVAATKQARSEFLTVEEYEKKVEEEKAKVEADLKQNPPSKEVLVAEAISKIPICDDGKRGVAELVKVITGMSISLPENIDETARPHISFSMMVPTKNENSHNYPLNIPVMMTHGIRSPGSDQNNAMRGNGVIGNCLEWDKSGLRPATDDEIDVFFKAWVTLSEIGVPLCDGFNIPA